MNSTPVDPTVPSRTASAPARGQRYWQLVALVALVLSVLAIYIWMPAHLAGALLILSLLNIGVVAYTVRRYSRLSSSLSSSNRELSEFKFALDQSAIVAVTDARGLIKYVNDKFCEISQYSRDELLGQDHRMLNSGLHPREFMKDLWATIGHGRVWRGEIRNRAKDGSLYWVDTTIVPFLDARGRAYQYLAIRSDITEKRRNEDALREQAALARLGEMAAVVAHEVKNPLAGIGGALAIISRRLPDDSSDLPIMAEVIERLDSLNQMVSDLLVFARPRPLQRAPVDLKELLTETAAFLQRAEAWREINVVIDGTAPSLSADPRQLRDTFQNILVNGAQAMGYRGELRVQLSHDPVSCQIAITDHGSGIPAEVRAKVFDPFFTTKTRGTGLGLAIARRVLEGHGGTIEVAPAASGIGTTFTLRLPRTRDHA